MTRVKRGPHTIIMGVSLPMVQNRATTWKNAAVSRPLMPKRASLPGGCRWRLAC
ncbi:hypothetical protein V8C34DRAFT_291280 [Trichoderma compactum]